MSMQVKYEAMACVDCLTMAANGEASDERPNIAAEMSDYLGDDLQHLCVGDSAKDDEFSWSQCDCCGSRLGGSRHHMVVLECV